MEKRWSVLFRVDREGTDILLFSSEREEKCLRIESNRELLERILPMTERLLRERGISPREVVSVSVESDLPDGYSSRRIAETVAEIWAFARRDEAGAVDEKEKKQ